MPGPRTRPVPPRGAGTPHLPVSIRRSRLQLPLATLSVGVGLPGLGFVLMPLENCVANKLDLFKTNANAHHILTFKLLTRFQINYAEGIVLVLVNNFSSKSPILRSKVTIIPSTVETGSSFILLILFSSQSSISLHLLLINSAETSS